MTLNTDHQTEKIEKPADFQTAISATKFGCYNVILLLVCLPAAFAVQFESTLISYIIPAAACDLNLSITQKGLLNSMPFFGMIATGLLTGFLLDTLGRRKILFTGFCIHLFVTLARSLSQSVAFLQAFQFFGGCLTGGFYVALTTYILEFHATEHRGRVQMIFAMLFSVGNIVIPLLSSAILPLNLNLHLPMLDFHSWNLLILITSCNPLFSVIAFYFLPETPKFLMSTGKNEEALNVFRNMYKLNTRNVKHEYPVKSLIEEITNNQDSATNKTSLMEYIKTGWEQIMPLFGKQYGLKLLLVCSVESMFLVGINSFRLYLPQIFQANHEYKLTHNGTSSALCHILGSLNLLPKNEGDACVVNLDDSFQVYLNSMIIAAVTMFAYASAGFLINWFGKKPLLGILGILASLSAFCLYFAPNITVTLTLASLYLACCGVCFDIFLSIIVVIFPTSSRAMAISVALCSGRGLTTLGNMIVPLLVKIGCAPPFIFWGCVIFTALALSFVLPTTGQEDMK
ncbi:hypothetical protein ABEB36_013420 [Hypothenemus hampei]|uniref:Major facilitator superfamily (MFS) profile domain-containing protein n=1 Tax=Hypothenemus hampei TaxID=57062 RepID=A0ABD1E7Z0_HYPHA